VTKRAPFWGAKGRHSLRHLLRLVNFACPDCRSAGLGIPGLSTMPGCKIKMLPGSWVACKIRMQDLCTARALSLPISMGQEIGFPRYLG
jgi:hypothetical protein